MDPASSEATSPPPPADGGQCTAPASTVAFDAMDVTQLCRTAASMLGPDEMIHDSDFSLYGAMSALELMDAKMDKPPPVLESLDQRIASGALPISLDASVPPLPPQPSTPTSPAPPPAAREEEAASSSPSPATGSQTSGLPPHPSSFSPSQRTLSVLDGMSVCEVAWHEGGSLPETLYACLYLHPAVFSAVLRGLGWPLEQAPGSSGARRRLDLKIKEGNFSWKPVDRALTLAVLAQSLATLRCCSLARDVVILADIFEEEDFYPSTFGFRLAPPVEDESLTDLLALAEAAMRARIKCAEPLRQTAGAGGGDSRSPDECILAHLESRTQLLRACLALRDAFTNKQRLKRLRALEKRRAEELAQRTAGAGAGTTTTVGAAETQAAIGGASAASGGLAAGQKDGSGSATTRGPEDDVEVDSEVVAAATGLAAMSIGSRCPPKAVQLDGGRGTAEKRSSSTVASEIGGRDVQERGAAAEVTGGQELPAAENGCSDAVGLVVEGRAVGRAGGGPGGATGTALAAPCAGEVIERKGEEEEDEEDEDEGEGHQQRSASACDDIETPLNGIARCGGHLRAATLALESLLAIEALVPGGAPAETTPQAEQPTAATAARNRPPVGGGVAAGAGAGAPSAAANGQGSGGNRKTPPLPPVKLGGDAGGFAFETEMNRHLLGSSPQHHVYFRRGRAEGPRTLLLLAREAERACGVIRCDDLLDVRRCLLRLYQPPAEGKGGPAVGTASLFARSVAAVCLYRQDMVLGRFDVMWFVAEAMTDVGVPDAVVNSPSGMAFLDRVGKPVYETLRTLCLNRGRQRMSLELQMQDWRTLQAYANTVDDAFQLQYGLGAGTQRYMSKWALTEVLGLMHLYLQVGVELQLPSAHEWSGMFWYWDYVMTTKMMAEGSLRESKDQLEAVKAQMEEERVMARELQEAAEAAEAAELANAAASAAAAAATPALSVGGGKKSKKKKRGGSKAKKPDAATEAAGPGPGVSPAGSGAEVGAVNGAGGSCARGKKEEAASATTGAQKTQREIRWAIRRDWETADMKLRQFLCRGSVRLIAGLESLGMMGQKAGEWSEFRFTSPEIIHRERFRAFQALETPAFQPHRAFLEAVEFHEREAAKVVDASAECFRAARTLASDLLRQGDLAVKEASGVGVVAAPAAPAAGGGCCSGGGCSSGYNAPTAAAVVDAVGGGWATDRLELLAMAKLAVSNGVAAMQVVKRASAGGAKGRARLEFDAHSQFPVVKATFD